MGSIAFPEDRLPPQNTEAEQGVLGGILREPGWAVECQAAGLAPEDFYRDDHATLCRRLYAMADGGRRIDALLVIDEMRRHGELERCGGDEFIARLMDAVPHTANTRYYAELVRDKARQRRVIEFANGLLRAGYAGEHTGVELVELAERGTLALADGSGDSEPRALPAIVADVADRLGRRRSGDYQGLATGLVDFDDLTDGLPDASLVVLAARPSMGKTALALNIAEYVALQAGFAVLFVSLEMGDLELGERLVVARARVDGHRVRTGRGLGDEHDLKLRRAYAELSAAPHFLVDAAPGRTPSQVASAARRAKARHDLGLIVVDYIQLLDPGQESRRAKESRQEQIAGISRRLKNLAREVGCPVLALSQLNRDVEKREDKRPRIADLRESGAIEQDADLVLLLHRPEYYKPGDQPGIAELDVAKNRNGRTGMVRLTFLKDLARFECHAPIDPAPEF